MEGELPPEDARAAARRARRGLGDQDQEERRVYPPQEVQARLQVSASGLRRLAGIYERTVGALPRDERGRVWPEDAVLDLEAARETVRDQRAVSIEAALRGQESPGAATQTAAGAEPRADPGGGLRGRQDVGAAILEELRALRMLVEEQSRRIGELEETVKTVRELEAPESAGETSEDAEPRPATDTPASGTEQPRTSWWRRFFGFE